MSHAPYDELVAGYALGALDGEDRERFDAHLAAGCGTCSRAILEYQETLAQAAAELAEAPPARVRTALLARLEPAVRPVPSRRPAATALRWAAGLALAAGITAWLTSATLRTRYQAQLQAMADEAATLRTQLAESTSLIARVRTELAEVQSRLTEQDRVLTMVRAETAEQARTLTLLQDPTTRIVTLAGLGPSPGAQGRMLWNPTRGGFLVAAALQPLPAGKVYELWAIAGKKPPVPAGVFTVDADGRGTLGVARLEAVPEPEVFAVTLEREGGALAPTGPMVLASKKA